MTEIEALALSTELPLLVGLSVGYRTQVLRAKQLQKEQQLLVQ